LESAGTPPHGVKNKVIPIGCDKGIDTLVEI
jgi:hypothetical protein